VAVRIRLKQMGRKHRPFYRICATDIRAPRDGKVIEELGTYDPMVPETDARVTLDHERVSYWLGVGAQPSETAAVLIKKYGPGGTHLEKMRQARERLKAKAQAAPPPPPAQPKKTKKQAQEEARAEQPSDA
jgi:small subunit ribosomal protein S16